MSPLCGGLDGLMWADRGRVVGGMRACAHGAGGRLGAVRVEGVRVGVCIWCGQKPKVCVCVCARRG